MKRIIAVILAVFLCLSLSSCALNFLRPDPLAEKYAGTYTHVSSGLVMYDGNDGKERDCELVIEKNKSGTFREDDDTKKLKWHAPDKNTAEWMASFEEIGLKPEIQLDEKSALSFIGLAKTFVGGFAENGNLILYDGAANDGWACRYEFAKKD